MRNAAANPEIRMLNRLPKFSSYPEALVAATCERSNTGYRRYPRRK
jgi:hypothetical protein